MKTMTSAGKMKCQASHTTRKMPDPGLGNALRVKKNELVQFQFSRCLAKEPITKAEVLNSVFKDYQDHFPGGSRSSFRVSAAGLLAWR